MSDKNNPIIKYDKDGKIKEEIYYEDGKIHRDPKDGPAVTYYDSRYHEKVEKFYVNGFLQNHRDGPLEILYYKDGNRIESYGIDRAKKPHTKFDKRLGYIVHREGLPAVIEYDKNNNIIEEEYHINNTVHREGAPAYISYDAHGNIRYESWRHNGKVHRIDGPATIFYDKNGKVKSEEFYINGKKIKNIFESFKDKWYESI